MPTMAGQTRLSLHRSLEILRQDIRYALRTLGKAPGFTAVAVLTLALGIGANTAIFTLIDQIVLRLLPARNAHELVLLTSRGRHYGNNSGGNAISYPMYRDFREQNQVFSEMLCRYLTETSLTSGTRPERVEAELVSGSYFQVLGVGAAVGRTFTPDDDRVPNGHPLVMLSHDYWKARFGGDPNIVGKALRLNDRSMTVIGVAQAGWNGVELGHAPKVFVPVMMAGTFLIGRSDMLIDRRSRWVNAFGRLKPGVTREQAKASLQPLMHAMLEREVREPAFNNASAKTREEFLKSWMDVLPGGQGRASARRQLSTPLGVLMATTGIVLLIACANIASLLLARSTARRKEIAVRLAVGASRGRIVGQLLIESVVLAALGGASGVALAFWADKLLMAFYLPTDSAGLKISAAPDARILLFTLAVTSLTALGFGLAPALKATRPDVTGTLKDEGRGLVAGGHTRLRKILVAAQVTLSVVLLIGAGLFLRSLNNLRSLGPGFPVERLIGFSVAPELNGYTLERSKIFYRQLTQSLASIPGVESAALAAVRILEGNEWDSSVTVERAPGEQGEHVAQPYMNAISPGYFATLGVPIVAGRDFTLADTRQVRHVVKPFEMMPATVMINETFARKHFPGRNPVGLHIGFGGDPGTPTDMEIISVVKDIKYTSLRDEIPEQAFIPYLASPLLDGMTVYLRTTAGEQSLMAAVRAKLAELDGDLPISEVRTTEAQITNSLTNERMVAGLSTVFGALATLLAILGLYGVMSYTVAQRTREIGVRMALGAARGTVVSMVMREVLMLVALGIIAGLAASLALTRVVQSQLFGVAAHDPSTLAVATVGLAIVACLAGYLPAVRASRVDPMVALRHD
jgi:predicted permease